MQWFEALAVYVSVVENKSFVKAARKLHLPTSKVTKLIQWLEDQLKTVLLIRTTRQLHLTENGEYFFYRAKNIVSEWQDLEQSMKDKEQVPSGKLHLGSPPTIFNTKRFMGIISEFLASYPEISIDISTFAKPIHFMQSHIDIFIGRDAYILDQSDVIGKTCLLYQYGIYSSPEYLKQHPKPKTPQDLLKHNCLGGEKRWEFRDASIEVQGNFMADVSPALQAAASHHLGIARIPDFLTQDLVKEKKLMPLLEEHYAKPMELKVYYQKLFYQPRKIKLFIDFLLKKMHSKI